MPFDADRDWMWAQACELLERAERLQRQFFQPGRRGTAHRPLWQPPVDLFEADHELWILVALPGVPEAAIGVEVEAGTLIVSGERPRPAALRSAEIHRMEIPYGRFERRIDLPAGRYRLEGREADHGCLVLRLHRLF